jgi:glycosyltransferase involved in cell wall biosynthesis
MPRSTVSAIIITKNEEHNITTCLDSIRWVDEIIVLDSNSTDRTVEICKEYDAKVFSVDWPGYGIQKQRALDKASSYWVLSIDADEYLSEELTENIKAVIEQDSCDACFIHRRLIFYGKEIKYCVGEDKLLRLAKKNKASFTQVPVHEKMQVAGNVKNLQGLMYHRSFHSVSDIVARMNHYSSISPAAEKRKKKCLVLQAISRGIWAFIRCYILKFGFLDGKAGLVFSISFAEGSYYRYLKMSYSN